MKFTSLFAPPRILTLVLPMLATLFLLALTGLTARATTPIILNQTRSAATGDVIFLQGDSFGTSTKVQYSYNSNSWVTLTALTSGNNAVTARIPFLTGKTGQNIRNLVTVRVYNGSIWSAPAFINRAHGISFDTPEVASGSTFRIFGRDLYYAQTPPVTPTVRLQDQTTHAYLPATVTTAGSSAYVLNVTAPSNIVPGDKYDVLVSNGYNGSGTFGTGETKSDEPLLGRAGNSDVWSLGVPWGADFAVPTPLSSSPYNVMNYGAVGNGSANDQPAIQAAINAAVAAGGGVVYLPAGTYALYSSPSQFQLELSSNVVLAGAGMNQTTIQYGFGPPPTPGGYQGFAIAFGGGNDLITNCGVADMTIQNVDSSGQWDQNIRMSARAGSSQLFLQRIHLETNCGNAIAVGNEDKVAIENSALDQLGVTNWWTNFIGVAPISHFVYRGNVVTWSGGQAMNVSYSSDGIIENNHFTRNCNYAMYPNVANTRCIDQAFDKNLVVLHNTFDVSNGPPANNNDGETISSEGAGPGPSDQDTGTVTSATATTLTDTSKNWTVPNDYRGLTTCFSNAAVVAIVAGKGAGEWQMIVPSTNSNTLTVPTNWIVTPDSTSKYAITDWACENWLIAGNTLSNNRVGIQLYFCSSHDTAIVGNTQTNDNGIMIQPNEMNVPASPPHSFSPAWDDQMIGNIVSETDGLEPAFVGVSSYELDAPTNQGTSVLGLEIRGNTVTGTGATFVQQGPSSVPNTEGYFSEYSIRSDAPATFTDYGVPAILGTIFQGNTANNCNTSTTVYPPYITINGAFRVNSGSYQAVLQDNVAGVTGTFLEDDLIPTYSHTSVNTYGSISLGKGNNWLDVDIGTTYYAGSASINNNVFTVTGAGGDIWGSNDGFNSCYETLTGNATIVARITSIGNTNVNGYSKAGVMIRASLTGTSPFAATVINANGRAQNDYRLTDGASTLSDGVTVNVTAPYWVKVTRVGSALTSWLSPNGVTWTQCGSIVTIPMTGTVYASLVESSSYSALCTSTFDNVSVTSP